MISVSKCIEEYDKAELRAPCFVEHWHRIVSYRICYRRQPNEPFALGLIWIAENLSWLIQGQKGQINCQMHSLLVYILHFVEVFTLFEPALAKSPYNNNKKVYWTKSTLCKYLPMFDTNKQKSSQYFAYHPSAPIFDKRNFFAIPSNPIKETCERLF